MARSSSVPVIVIEKGTSGTSGLDDVPHLVVSEAEKETKACVVSHLRNRRRMICRSKNGHQLSGHKKQTYRSSNETSSCPLAWREDKLTANTKKRACIHPLSAREQPGISGHSVRSGNICCGWIFQTFKSAPEVQGFLEHRAEDHDFLSTRFDLIEKKSPILITPYPDALSPRCLAFYNQVVIFHRSPFPNSP